MASINDLKTSKFLKKEDVGDGSLVTIKTVHQENVAKEGADPEMKWCLTFEELDKPMVLNSTNGQIIAKITGAEDNIETAWVGSRSYSITIPTYHSGATSWAVLGFVRQSSRRKSLYLFDLWTDFRPLSSSRDFRRGLISQSKLCFRHRN